MINFKNKDLGLIQQAIADVGEILTSDGNGNLIISDETAIQAIIDALPDPMPNLLPVQFHFLLAKYSFDDAIDSLLIALKNEDIDKYAMYKSYLNAARFYEFDKALIMFNEILDKFAAINPALALSESQLRAMWLEASQV